MPLPGGSPRDYDPFAAGAGAGFGFFFLGWSIVTPAVGGASSAGRLTPPSEPFVVAPETVADVPVAPAAVAATGATTGLWTVTTVCTVYSKLVCSLA